MIDQELTVKIKVGDLFISPVHSKDDIWNRRHLKCFGKLEFQSDEQHSEGLESKGIYTHQGEVKSRGCPVCNRCEGFLACGEGRSVT